MSEYILTYIYRGRRVVRAASVSDIVLTYCIDEVSSLLIGDIRVFKIADDGTPMECELLYKSNKRSGYDTLLITDKNTGEIYAEEVWDNASPIADIDE